MAVYGEDAFWASLVWLISDPNPTLDPKILYVVAFIFHLP